LDDQKGVKHYAYPSIAVNVNGDAVVGYNCFGSDQFPSANYAMHKKTDAPGAMQADTLFKDGPVAYERYTDGRWGDYSSTVVDPVNDLDIWTIQQFATTKVNWGTWWKRIKF
jgi:hypothetical protein